MSLRRKSVLLVSSGKNKALIEALLDRGVEILVRSAVLSALQALRRQDVAAVAIDLNHTELDLLELILNIRDLDAAVPVVLFGEPEESPGSAVLASLGPIEQVSGWQSLDDLAEQIVGALMELYEAGEE